MNKLNNIIKTAKIKKNKNLNNKKKKNKLNNNK